jgi:hypothetical protein
MSVLIQSTAGFIAKIQAKSDTYATRKMNSTFKLGH